MAVSDTLWQAIEDIREYQEHGVIASFDDPELTLVLAVMSAELRKRDQCDPPPARFTSDVVSAFDEYRRWSSCR